MRPKPGSLSVVLKQPVGVAGVIVPWNSPVILMIRSLALGQVTAGNFKLLLKKELAIAGLNGLVWGSLAGLAAWGLYYGSPNAVMLGLLMTLAASFSV